jgi:hypothetical protein
MSYEFDQIADAIRDEMREIARDEIIQAKDNGDLLSNADIDDTVRDLISNMDTSDFVDTDTVAESVFNHYTFNDAVDDAVMQKLDYEGMGETPTLIEGLEERVNALEANPAATDNDGFNALVNTVTELGTRVNRIEEGGTEHDVTNLMDANRNLTERIVYLEGIANALVDAFISLGHSMTKPVLVPGDRVPVQAAPRYAGPTTDDAPYAAI